MAFTDWRAVPPDAAVATVASAALVLAAFLPWISEPGGTATGIDAGVRDGYLAMGVAVAIVAAVLVLEWNRTARVVTALGGLGAILLFSNWFPAAVEGPEADPRAGLYLLLAAALALVAAAGAGEYRAVRADEVPAPGVEGNGDSGSA